MNRRRLLLKTFITASSRKNILKHETDAKKRRGMIGIYFAQGVLYGMEIFFVVSVALGFYAAKLGEMIPLLAVLVASAMLFIFTLFKSNAYLFEYKEYDQIIAMPFSIRNIVGAKFLYMYYTNLGFYLCAVLPAALVHVIFCAPNLVAIIYWLVMILVLPFIPMGLATFIGSFIANISSHTKFKQVFQAVFSLVFTLLCFSLRFIIEGLAKDGKYMDVIEQTSVSLLKIAKFYPPAGWFYNALSKYSFFAFLLFTVISVAVLEAIVYFISLNYTQIHSRLSVSAHNKKFKMKQQKGRDIRFSISFKEYRRFMGSNAYLLNLGLGVVFAVIIMIASLTVGFDKVLTMFNQGNALDKSIVLPAIPLIIYFFTGMVTTTAVSHSLEGKSFWVIQTLPIKISDYFEGKMLFNIVLFLPVSVLSVVCVGLSAKASFVEIVLFVILVALLIMFSTVYGTVLNIKWPKFEYENEIEVIKRGTAVAVYIFSNMFPVMGFIALDIVLGFKISTIFVLLINIAVASILLLISFIIYKSKIKKMTFAM